MAISNIVRALYNPKSPHAIPYRFRLIVGQMVDFKKPKQEKDSYQIIDSEYNRKLFGECGIHPEDLIDNFCGWQNVELGYQSNQEALHLLRRN